MSILNETFFLANDVAIPKIGFASWHMPSATAAYEATLAALEAGYRHIDTVRAGDNEKGIGRAVRSSGIPREQVFVTARLPVDVNKAMAARLAFQESLARLDLGYVDLYLADSPRHHGSGGWAGVRNVWRTLEDLYIHGGARAIGVRDFGAADLQRFGEQVDIAPHANQLAWFVGNRQASATAWCRSRGILVEGYSPLATGPLIGQEAIARIAARHGRTPTQVSIRYLLEHGVLPLPRAVTVEQIRENAGVDFDLEPDEVAELDRFTKVASNGFGTR